jgi:hypothetical protein
MLKFFFRVTKRIQRHCQQSCKIAVMPLLIPKLLQMFFAATILLGANASSGIEDRLPERFNFVAATRDTSIKLEAAAVDGKRPPQWQAKLQVDGIATDAVWPEHPPTAYKISERFVVLDDTYSGGTDYVWDRREHELTAIGRCTFSPPTDIGRICFRLEYDDKSSKSEVLDFDPDTGKPRVLLSRSPAQGRLIGLWNESPVLAMLDEKVAVLIPGRMVQEMQFELQGYDWPQSGAAIRDNKALMMKPDALTLADITKHRTYNVQAAILNLDSGEMKQIGQFAGGWTIDTAVPRPAYSLVWTTEEESKNRADERVRKFNPFLGGAGIGFVMVDKEELFK